MSITLLVVGVLTILGCVAAPGICFSFFGDEMPGWLEDYLPALAAIGSFLGCIICFTGLGMLIVEAS